jgi:hypothetical protein
MVLSIGYYHLFEAKMVGGNGLESMTSAMRGPWFSISHHPLRVFVIIILLYAYQYNSPLNATLRHEFSLV